MLRNDIGQVIAALVALSLWPLDARAQSIGFEANRVMNGKKEVTPNVRRSRSISLTFWLPTTIRAPVSSRRNSGRYSEGRRLDFPFSPWVWWL